MRIQLFGDEVERIASVDPLTGEVVEELDRLVLFPASHYVTSEERMQAAIAGIEVELGERLAWLERHGKLLEAQRLRMRTTYDLEMLREVGVCSGIENYSRSPRRPLGGGGAVHAARLLPRRLPRRPRRVARDRPPAARPVRGGPVPQGDPRRARLPAPVRARQPAAALRRVHREGEPGRLPLGDAEPLRVRGLRPGRRADRAPHRPHRPRGRRPAHEGPDRRPGRRDPGAGEPRAAGARHDAHQEDGRGPHRLPRRARRAGPLPAQRGRHARAGRDPPGLAARRVRRPRRHQPAPGGPRPARGVARRDPRRRQGGLPALRDVAHPDDRPGGPQRRRPGRHVRRPGDRLDAARRSPRPTGAATRSSRTTSSTASTPRRSARRSPTSSTWSGPATTAAATAPAAGPRPRPAARPAPRSSTWPASPPTSSAS